MSNNIVRALAAMIPGSEEGIDYTIQDDGNGPYIKYWTSVYPQPTYEEIASFSVAVDRDLKWVEIKAERERRRAGGLKITVSPGVEKWFHTDETSRLQQLALSLLDQMPSGLMWKTMDGSFVEMTTGIANALFEGSVAQDQLIFSRAEYHRYSMMASEDPSSYDFSYGWPEIYEGQT